MLNSRERAPSANHTSNPQQTNNRAKSLEVRRVTLEGALFQLELGAGDCA